MTGKIRVLYFYPYLQFDTGSPKALAQMIDILDRDLFQPVYAAAGSGPLPKALASRGVEIVTGHGDAVALSHPLRSLNRIRANARALRSWNIDMVHANCFPWNTDLLLAAWALKIPVILHVHNPLAIETRNLLRFAASKVLFCSKSSIKTCEHVNRVQAKSEVFYNMIDLDRFDRGRSMRGELGLTATDIAIGTVGQLIHRKGIDVLLDVARILLKEGDDLVFFVAGPIAPYEEEFGRQMIAAATDPAFRNRVRFLGSIQRIPEFLASMDLFVLPTRGETLGIAVLEAMAAGLPVIATGVGGVPEIISSPALGLCIDTVSSDAFAGTIRDVLSLPDRGKAMGQRAKESLRGRFDTASGGERLKKIYLDCLKIVSAR